MPVHHMVLMKMKVDITKTQIENLFLELKSLADDHKVPGLSSFSGGPYSSPEGFNKGYTHGFSMIFDSSTARDEYLPHTEHLRVVSILLPLVDDVIAFDYEL